MGRVVCLACLIAVAGCHAVMRPAAPESSTSAAPRAEEEPPPKVEATPVSRVKGKATILPTDAPDALELAADCLGRGDSAGAAGHLAKHVERFPDQVLFRVQLAELLFDQERFAAAGRHYAEAIGYAQDGSPAARKQLIHCHTRLMEVARATDDTYAERLHRGIGLYLVGKQLAARAESTEAERLLCKAAVELKEAHEARPHEARAAWYLYRVWENLDQPRPAERALRQARAAAPFSEMTAAEARELAMVR